MKVLVTGATGFIGSHLIRELLKNKSNQIVATSRSIDKAKKSDWFSKVEYIEYDFNEGTSENLYDFFGKPDQLIHLAWENLSNYNSSSHIEVILPNHCDFIESMVLGGLKNVVVTGTCFEYGMIEGCLSEDINTKPENLYAVAKDSLRKFIVNLHKKNSFVYKWIRLFYMYGDGQSKTSLMYLLDKAIQDKRKEFNMSGGEQLRDFLPIDKVVQNIDLIANQDILINQSINCCSGEPISVKNLVKNYLKERQYQIKLNLGFYPYLNYEAMNFWGDNSKLKKLENKIKNIDKKYKLLYQQKNFPVFQNRMYETEQDAIDCPKANIYLVQNQDTGLIYNLDFNPELMEYDKHYQNEQAVSPSFQKHLDSVAKIVKRGLGSKSLVEVGCGKAYFLELLQSKGVEITGFDPTYEGKNKSIERNYFKKGFGVEADGLILRHVLEHIQNPIEFLQELNIANKGKGRVYIEVPCLDWIVENKAWYDIFYEHVNYFRLSDLNNIFGNVVESGKVFGGQYIYIVAELSSIQRPEFDTKIHSMSNFEFDVDKDISTSPLVVWGGASKGVIYSLLKIRGGSDINMVIDINPAKQGKRLPATGLLVYSPKEAIRVLPEGTIVHVMNENYMEEIKKMTQNKFVYVGI